MNVRTKFEVCRLALPVPETIAIEFWGLRTPNLREEEAIGVRGWYRSKERW